MKQLVGLRFIQTQNDNLGHLDLGQLSFLGRALGAYYKGNLEAAAAVPGSLLEMHTSISAIPQMHDG